jgi:hypothetical protein
MSIHILTEEVTLQSSVDIVGPPGVNKESIIRLAMLEQTVIRGKIPLTDVATEMHIQDPVYTDGHHWQVHIMYRVKTTNLCEFD